VTTRYETDDSGIEASGSDYVSHPSRLALGRTQPPLHWVPRLSRVYSGRGMAVTTHPNLEQRLKEE